MRTDLYHRLRRIFLSGASILLLGLPGRGQTGPANDLADKSIEELMNVDVTTASRKEQKLSKVPAAVYVVTQEAIKRSGATNIPDVLRVVPGVQVAQVEANRWAISVRGFNSSYSNKLLVLVDGRTVYTPSFSGVYWDQIDIPLDTIERIEVVRGSGGAVWGANAVNGVINIITMNSKDTPGFKVEAGGGSQERGDIEARYGQKLGGWGTYRVFGDYRNFRGLLSPAYATRPDGWQIEQGGFRLDARLSSKDQLIIDGDGFNTTGGELLGYAGNPVLGVLTRPLENDGYHILTRWTRDHSDTSETSLQIYDSNYRRNDSGLNEKSNTVDVDFQNRTKLGARNDVVWGGDYRFTSDGARMTMSENQALLTGGLAFSLNPESMQYSLFSGFAQDEVSIGKSVSVAAGSKIEHNAFSGLELEPTVRLLWTPTDGTTFWAAASRSVRQPSLIETSLLVKFAPLPLAPGLLLSSNLAPNRYLASETAKTYEAGYRVLPTSRLSIDLTSFYTDYRNLHMNNPGTPGLSQGAGVAVLQIPTTYGNTGSARTFGAEVVAATDLTSHWKLSGNYSWLSQRGTLGSPGHLAGQLAVLLPPGAAADLASGLTARAGSSSVAGAAPDNAFSIQSYFDATRKWTLDQSIYFVGALPALGVASYTRVDAHFSYRLSHTLQASFVGQNLLAPRHWEFSEPSQLVPTEPERSIFGRLMWSF